MSCLPGGASGRASQLRLIMFCWSNLYMEWYELQVTAQQRFFCYTQENKTSEYPRNSAQKKRLSNDFPSWKLYFSHVPFWSITPGHLNSNCRRIFRWWGRSKKRAEKRPLWTCPLAILLPKVGCTLFHIKRGRFVKKWMWHRLDVMFFFVVRWCFLLVFCHRLCGFVQWKRPGFIGLTRGFPYTEYNTPTQGFLQWKVTQFSFTLVCRMTSLWMVQYFQGWTCFPHHIFGVRMVLQNRPTIFLQVVFFFQNPETSGR